VLVFVEGGLENWRTWRKTLGARQEPTQLTYVWTLGQNNTWATLLGGKRHPHTIPAPLQVSFITLTIQYFLSKNLLCGP